jgi:hypothetical protein
MYEEESLGELRASLGMKSRKLKLAGIKAKRRPKSSPIDYVKAFCQQYMDIRQSLIITRTTGGRRWYSTHAYNAMF